MDRIPVGILGATGMVGQKFVSLLAEHPWFEIAALAAGERSAGKPYAEAVNWLMSTPLPPSLAEMPVSSCIPNLPCAIVFSGLDASVAFEIEEQFAKSGYTVISNSRNHRMNPSVPLLIPEVNPDHLQLIKKQAFNSGKIITNPNCSVVGICLALKPLLDCFGIESLYATTLQAISGAGYPGVASYDIIDNVIPFIPGEEEKVETEPLKIFGEYANGVIEPSTIKISAQCNRVAVKDGHMACISVKLQKKASFEEIIESWNNFTAEPQALNLPSAPKKPLVYLREERYPQPRIHRNHAGGMAVAIGRLRPCSLLDWKFVILSHNTVRGAAGSAILNGELLVKKEKRDQRLTEFVCKIDSKASLL